MRSDATAGLVGVGLIAVLFGITPHPQLGGQRPDLMMSLYASWMALLAQPALSPPPTWYLALLSGLYPVLGFLLVGEGLPRVLGGKKIGVRLSDHSRRIVEAVEPG